jgi:hypothetical protein
MHSHCLQRKPWAVLINGHTPNITANKTNIRVKIYGFTIQGVFHVRLLGTRVKTRNCISEPGSQEPYRDTCIENPYTKYIVHVRPGD